VLSFAPGLDVLLGFAAAWDPTFFCGPVAAFVSSFAEIPAWLGDSVVLGDDRWSCTATTVARIKAGTNDMFACSFPVSQPGA
jgi:hypothetical protein